MPDLDGDGNEQEADSGVKMKEATCDHALDVGMALQSFGDPLGPGWYQFSTELNLFGDSLKYEARCLTCDQTVAVKTRSHGGKHKPFDGPVLHFKSNKHRNNATVTAAAAATGRRHSPPRVALQEQHGPRAQRPIR